MKENKPIKAKDLKHALTHIRGLIFGEHTIFDNGGHLREVIQEGGVIFEEGDDETTFAELHNEIHHLKQLVHKDELTGVLNRRGVREEFGRFFKEALYSKEHSDHRQSIIIRDLSVIFFDIDNFKSVNDIYGHDEGDRILKEVANTLVHHVRGIDAVGRFGGEEFVVGLLGADENQAFDKGEEIRTTIDDRVHLKDGANLTVSVGIASLKHSSAETFDTLIDFADKAMYEAKHKRGKNNTVRYSEIA